jgi:hypothetical protein
MIQLIAAVSSSELPFDSFHPSLTEGTVVAQDSHLQQTRKHDVSLLLVLVAKLLAIGALLAHTPGVHVRAANGNEQCDRRATADENHADPGQDLKRVVGARHQAETQTLGDLALGTAGAAKRGQVLVDQEVASLAKDKQGQANSVDSQVLGLRRGREGGVDLDGGQNTRDRPVEEGVAEHVPHGHRARRESVHERGLVLPLGEVNHDAGERELLRHGERTGGVGRGHEALDVRVDGGIDVGAQAQRQGVEDQGAQVLDHEDGAPGQLRAEVLDEQLLVLEVAQQRLPVLQRLLGRRVEEADLVVVRDARLAGDGYLGVFDRCIFGELERRREALDGLFGCCSGSSMVS